MAKAKKKSRIRVIFEWAGIIGGCLAVIGMPVSIALFINNKQHKMEMINQQHNLDLQHQHDEFEEKLSEVKDQLEDCKQQYRLLEIENRRGSHEK